MKKRILFVIIISLIFVNGALMPRPYFIPEGASWRIDIYPGFKNCTMRWYEVSKYFDENGNPIWGQGQCGLPGGECHCYDWVTWWFGIAWVPEPPEGWTSLYGINNFPTYNPNTGNYEY